MLIFIYMPNIDKDDTKDIKSKLPISVYKYAVGAFGLMVVFFIIPTNIAVYIQSNGFGDASAAGFAIAIATAAGFFSGLFFKQIYKITDKFHVPLVILSSGTGILLMNKAASLSVIMLGTGFIGAGNGLILPAIYVGATKAAGAGNNIRAMGGIVTAMMFFGQFMSPIIMDGIGAVFGDTSFTNLSRIAYILIYAFAAFTGIKALLTKSNN